MAICFAETTCKKDIRRHIEGCIAKNLGVNHPNKRQFYPSDNRTGVKKEKLRQRLLITGDAHILSLDEYLDI